jgi:hypothetical protein
VPASAWADTQRVAPRADLGAPATQIVGDRDAYLGQGGVGRRIAEDQVELFITGDVAGALQREFQAQDPSFITLHDVGCSSSLRLLGGLAAAAGAKVQRLSVRRQGHGLALAVLQFVEVPLPDGSGLRVYSTDVSGDGAARLQLAQVLLAHSRLGVLMVGDLPLTAVSTALHPLHEKMARGVWPNRELLMLPVAGNATLAQQAAELALGTPVEVQLAPRAAKPRQIWAFISHTWNRAQGQAAQGRALNADIDQALARPGATPVADEAETVPMGLDTGRATGRNPRPELTPPAAPAAAAAPLRPAPPAAARPPVLAAQPLQAPAPVRAPPPPARFVPAAELPPGFASRAAAPAAGSLAGAATPTLTPAPIATPMPVPGSTRWQDYADHCRAVKGVQSVCVFDTHTLQPLAHAGGLPGAERLAQQGALLLAEMVDVARALGFGSTRPDAAISLGGHHLLLYQVPGHPGVAVHLVLLAAATHLAVARVQLERVPAP